MENKTFQLAEKTINQVFNYLITKPYNEVAQMIAMMQQDIQYIQDNEGVADKEKVEE